MLYRYQKATKLLFQHLVLLVTYPQYLFREPFLADIEFLTGNISPKSVKRLITKTKAIVLIAYGGTHDIMNC